jgi:hypothetical protein
MKIDSNRTYTQGTKTERDPTLLLVPERQVVWVLDTGIKEEERDREHTKNEK